MNKLRKFSQFLFAIALLFGGLGSQPARLAMADDSLPIDPAFLQFAQEHPDDVFAVIVQKAQNNGYGQDEEPDQQAANGGGRLKKQLDFISSFSAELTGAEIARLANNKKVIWISYDAPMFSSAGPDVSTAWATSIGTAITNQFTNASLMVDGSGLGPNGTFGSRTANGKGTFGGLNVEVVPGNAITRVEVVFYAYLNSAFSKDFKVKAYINGSAQSEVKVKTTIFPASAQNVGLVYIDITSTRQWKWADFYNNLELYVEQTGFSADNIVSYDSVGLRITSEPGIDASLDTLSNTTIADSTVDGSKQVNVYNNVIGATQLWNTTNKLQGKDVTVAVVDSGIYKTDDLSGRIKVNLNFNPAFHDGIDRYGHGTFVAGVIAGSGKKSSGKYIGVAPKARLVNVRISDDQGMVFESDVIDSLQWVLNNKDKYGIRVANLSLNSTVAQSYNTSPLCAAVEILWFNSITVVVSAGNNGTPTLFPPANDPFVITVGATDDKATVSTADDTMASFSSYGVTESGFAKPDLVAPGRLIIGLLPENNRLSMSMNRAAQRVDTTYFKMSGTSISAPMVSGAVAILLQDEPNLTPDQVKYRLMATANKSWPGYNAAKAGAGYLNIYAAVNGTTTQSANTGLTASQLLWSGSNPVTWGSVAWNSVAWNSVAWNSVAWNSVAWNSVAWNSDYWEP